MTIGEERTHWSRWHDDYEDPSSSLSWRLSIVQRRFSEALDVAPGPVRVLSLCAGQGRDVVDVLCAHPRREDVTAVLVDNDVSNCDFAATRAAEHRLANVDVRCADAADVSTYADAVPADVLLLCGIFGNITDEDVKHTVDNAARLCAPGATVLWTRHRKPPDLTVAIRAWFAAAGFADVAFETRPGDSYAAVGTERLNSAPLPFDPELRLFTFLR
jgi:ubiquinone/menaquinone biosynthesis C-methylase UbiE